MIASWYWLSYKYNGVSLSDSTGIMQSASMQGSQDHKFYVWLGNFLLVLIAMFVKQDYWVVIWLSQLSWGSPDWVWLGCSNVIVLFVKNVWCTHFIVLAVSAVILLILHCRNNCSNQHSPQCNSKTHMPWQSALSSMVHEWNPVSNSSVLSSNWSQYYDIFGHTCNRWEWSLLHHRPQMHSEWPNYVHNQTYNSRFVGISVSRSKHYIVLICHSMKYGSSTTLYMPTC